PSWVAKKVSTASVVSTVAARSFRVSVIPVTSLRATDRPRAPGAHRCGRGSGYGLPAYRPTEGGRWPRSARPAAAPGSEGRQTPATLAVRPQLEAQHLQTRQHHQRGGREHRRRLHQDGIAAHARRSSTPAGPVRIGGAPGSEHGEVPKRRRRALTSAGNP